MGRMTSAHQKKSNIISDTVRFGVADEVEGRKLIFHDLGNEGNREISFNVWLDAVRHQAIHR